jgi:hypothetical protein
MMLFSAAPAFNRITDFFIDDIDPISAFSAFSNKIHSDQPDLKNENN